VCRLGGCDRVHRPGEPAPQARPLLVPSYVAASCGRTPLSIIRHYIEQKRNPVNATSGLTLP